MIHVLATIQLSAGSRDAFLKAFHELMPLVRAEAGCLEYGPAVDLSTNIPSQPALRDNVVVVVEKWADLAALEAHLVAPHMLDWRPKVKHLVEGTQIQVLAPA